MEYNRLVQEACELHMQSAKSLYKIIENFLNRGETRILLWLGKQDTDVYAVDIIEYFGLSAGRVANILKSLETKGYLLRVKNNTDHRRAAIILTDKGKEYAEDIFKNLQYTFYIFFKAIGDEDARNFLVLERKIMGMIESGDLNLESRPRT